MTIKPPLYGTGVFFLSAVAAGIAGTHSPTTGVAIVSSGLVITIIIFFYGPVSDAIGSASEVDIGLRGIKWKQLKPRPPKLQLQSLEENTIRNNSPQAKTAAFLAQDLVLRAIALDLGSPVIPQVIFGTGDYGFDGMLFPPGQRIAVQVKYVDVALDGIVVQHLLSRDADRVSNNPKSGITKLIIAVVSAAELPQNLDSQLRILRKEMPATKVPTELLVFDFGQLKTRFGLERD